jgi:Rrf2 family protein
MRISARCEYACKALLELALHWPSRVPLQVHIISERQAIPMRYLIQILIQLKRMGLVASTRGKEGGYNLTLSPNRIKLGQVLREVGGPLLPVANSDTNRDKNPIFPAIWKEVEGAMSRVLDRVTFEDIANKAKGMGGAIIYQI